MAKKDEIIHKSGRARTHTKYVDSLGNQQPGGSTIGNLVSFSGADGLMYWAVKLHKEGQDFKTFRDESAQFGNTAHRAVECLWKGERFDEENYISAYVEPAKIMAENYFKCLTNMGLEMVGSEEQAVADGLWGGTMDVLLREKGEEGVTCLADLKTSSSINSGHLIQVAGCYSKLFEVKYGAPPRRVILFRMDRNAPHSCIPHEVNQEVRAAAEQAALLARQLWALKPALTARF